MLSLLVSVAKGVPHYYVEGYGCTLTAAASEWSDQMHISEPALHGYLWATNQSLTFLCPSEYGIIVELNGSALSSSGWNSHPKCTGLFYRSPYMTKEITAENLPLYVEYMCAKHHTNVWYAGAFTIDRASRVKEAELSSSTMFATAYTSSNYYRNMQYSAAALVLAGLLVIGANCFDTTSMYHKTLAAVAALLAVVAFFGLVVSVSKISQASPRPYSGRKAHQVLGLVTLVAIAFSLILGAISFWKRGLGMIFDTLATLALLLILATSSVALVGFYHHDTAVVVSIAVALGVVFINSYIIRRAKPVETSEGKFVPEEKVPLVERRTRTNRKTFF